jgi:hypothetical protein
MVMDNENGNGVEKEKEQALVRLVNLTFATETGLEKIGVSERYAELTDIPRRMVNHLAVQMMREVALNKERIELGIPLSKCWRTFYFMLMRSVGRRQLMTAQTLAESQITAQAEAEDEAFEL